jgi:hypothetical protein
MKTIIASERSAVFRREGALCLDLGRAANHGN